MIRIRRAAERGRTQLPWLDGRHTFSFGGYVDPEHRGFRTLRVINDDVIAPGGGFDTHPHHDMEILTVMLAGSLRHADSMGNGSVIRPGEVQRMSAGSGVLHSEHNASAEEPAHLLQIWIFPAERGIEPGYEQRAFDTASRPSEWITVASQDGRDGSVTVHQDATVRRAFLPAGGTLPLGLDAGRSAWLHVATGAVTLVGAGSMTMGEHELGAGDGVALDPGFDAVLTAVDDADLLLFDLA